MRGYDPARGRRWLIAVVILCVLVNVGGFLFRGKVISAGIFLGGFVVFGVVLAAAVIDMHARFMHSLKAIDLGPRCFECRAPLGGGHTGYCSKSQMRGGSPSSVIVQESDCG